MDNGNDEYTIFGVDFFMPNIYVNKEFINVNGISLLSSRLDVENKLGNFFEKSPTNRAYTFYIKDKAILMITFLKDSKKNEIGDNILFISYYWKQI